MTNWQRTYTVQAVAIRWFRKEELHISRAISCMSEKHGNILNVVVVRETNMEIVTENHNRAS
jgi:hypothetical protein